MAKASQTLKRLTLELGGKSANIVCEDADLDAAVIGSLHGIFYNTGQSCEARSRLLVHEDVYDSFMERFVGKAKGIKLGDPFDESVQVGSIISEDQVNVIDNYVKGAVKDGATILYGGKRPEGEVFERGHWYMPTIIGNVTNDMKVAQEEIFGPVVVVMKYSDDAEAIKIANDTIYGLAGAVWMDKGSRKGTSAGICY